MSDIILKKNNKKEISTLPTTRRKSWILVFWLSVCLWGAIAFFSYLILHH